ncbi:hypothetical protein SUGI_0553690 [Cryptomeria japonica]|nr:hypothetical protein SUGI_0553690 [Cryptomeria japonica]
MEAFKSQSETQSKAPLEFALGMKGGNGDSSYANNSSPQLRIIQAVRPILENGIYENMKLKFDVRGIFRIADFGCGTGQNTLLVADTIILLSSRCVWIALQTSLRTEKSPILSFFYESPLAFTGARDCSTEKISSCLRFK